MEEAKQLVRMAVRTFFPSSPKYALIIDGLVFHAVCDLSDLQTLTSMQAKEFRTFFHPLRSHRLVHVDTRTGRNITASTSNNEYSNRSTKRDVYWINYADAVNCIKYRIAKLRKRVADMYQQDETKIKAWKCPRCKSAFGELEVLDKVNDKGFYCAVCGFTLEQDTASLLDKGSNEKIRRLNDQLTKFDALIEKIDKAVEANRSVLEQTPDAAEARKIDVPDIDSKSSGKRNQWIEINKSGQKKDLANIKAEDLQVNITSGAEQAAEEAQRKEEERKRIAKQNKLPEWYANSAIGLNTDPAATANAALTPNSSALKQEDEDEKKSALVNSSGNAAVDEQVAAYMAQMEKEARERAAAGGNDSDSDEEEDDEDDEFEDVGGMGTSAMGTPMSSQDIPKPVNGIKRERSRDDEEESSEANTPMPGVVQNQDREVKRVKVEDSRMENVNGLVVGQEKKVVVKNEDVDSDEEEDFEDV